MHLPLIFFTLQKICAFYPITGNFSPSLIVPDGRLHFRDFGKRQKIAKDGKKGKGKGVWIYVCCCFKALWLANFMELLEPIYSWYLCIGKIEYQLRAMNEEEYVLDI